MSIEAMKRIKSLLQDTKTIDSHTISAVVAECDAVILAQQPATGEPVAVIPADGPSTYEQRFTDAVRAICGVTPPAELVSYWISNTERDDDLQQWVGSYAPGWVQNIAVLDAAHVMATQPTEGGAHRTE